MVNLDQQRAAFAWQRVEEAKSKLSEKDYKSYKNLAKSAPALIMNNGLMQTLAFFTSKGKDHHGQLQGDILAWLEKQKQLPSKDYTQAMNFLHSKANSEQYRLATDETMHLLRWLRQFADSEFADSEQ